MPFVVLLVEDHEDTRAMCALGLALEGFVVREAASAAAALAILDRELPDVVVTDLAMPGMDGVEMCRRIRERPNGKRVPILAVTGHSHSPAFAEVASAGACAASSKPLAPDALTTLVRALVEERSICNGCWETAEVFQCHALAENVRWWKRSAPPGAEPRPSEPQKNGGQRDFGHVKSGA